MWHATTSQLFGSLLLSDQCYIFVPPLSTDALFQNMIAIASSFYYRMKGLYRYQPHDNVVLCCCRSSVDRGPSIVASLEVLRSGWSIFLDFLTLKKQACKIRTWSLVQYLFHKDAIDVATYSNDSCEVYSQPQRYSDARYSTHATLENSNHRRKAIEITLSQIILLKTVS
jgi:hypothetical protein